MADATDGGGGPPLVKLTPTFEAAVSYARRGWRVFPVYEASAAGACSCGRPTCERKGKHPRTPHGHRDATTDEAQVRAWWRTWPNAGVAIATGDGLVVVDIDPRHHGDDTVRELERALGALPNTVQAITGGGGWHVYLHSAAPIPSSVAKLGEGVDVRGEGGYVVAPPTRHESGRAYAWEASGDPEEVALATIPDAWAARCAPPPAPAGATGATGAAPIASGQRNGELYRLARSLRAKSLSPEAVRAAIDAENLARCVPPLGADEVARIVANACNAPAGPSARVAEREAQRDAAERRVRVIEKPPPPPPRDDGWRGLLRYSDKGGVAPSFLNVTTALRHAARFASLRFNEMSQSPEIDGRNISDAAVGRIREWLEREASIATSETNLRMGLLTVAEERRYHPVREYLAGLAWDEEPRIERIGPEILHTDDPLAGTFLRAWLVGAVARPLQPGCKNDAALVFVGPQGARKSTFFRVLAGPWFSDTHFDITNKDAFLSLASAWIHELGEIERVTSRRGADEVKQFMSSATDKFRPPYGRSVVEVPRSSVMCGTTNQPQFLEDDTGSRRFLILTVPGEIDTDTLEEWRGQIWAEAVQLWASGEPWHLTRKADALREKAAETYSLSDPWADLIVRHLAKLTRNDVTTEELLSDPLDIPKKDRTKAQAMRAAKILRALGWARDKQRLGREPYLGADPVWAWFRPVPPGAPPPGAHPDEFRGDTDVPL